MTEHDPHHPNTALSEQTETFQRQRFTLQEAAELIDWGYTYLPRYSHNTLAPHLEPYVCDDEKLALDLPDYALHSILSTLELSRDSGAYMSPRLRRDPSAELHSATEINEYLGQLTEWRREELFERATEILEQPLNKDKLQAYVVIPVAAGEDSTTLEKTMAQYAKQTLPSDHWALLLYVNAFDQTEAQFNETIHEAERLKEKFPELPIRCAETRYLEKPTMGEIRADAWDLVMVDLQQNDVKNEIIGISHDADCEWMSPDYIEQFCKAAQQQPDKDLLTCRLDWGHVGKFDSDANRLLMYWSMVNSARRYRNGEEWTSDNNTAFRMGTYAAVGGYSINSTIGETIDLRNKIALARAPDKILQDEYTDSIVEYVTGARLKQNARRVYQALQYGIAPNDAWTHMPFLTGIDPVRSAPTKELAQAPISRARQYALLARIEKTNLTYMDSQVAARLRDTGRRLLGYI